MYSEYHGSPHAIVPNHSHLGSGIQRAGHLPSGNQKRFSREDRKKPFNSGNKVARPKRTRARQVPLKALVRSNFGDCGAHGCRKI
jgi:hypothetical protein